MRRTGGPILAAALGLAAAGGCYAELAGPESEVPACVPWSCQPGYCGETPDGCGATLSCWCPAGTICEQSSGLGLCVGASPPTCEELGAECGLVSLDGGSQTLNCGDCPDGPCASGGAAPNRCPCVPATVRLGSLDEDPAAPGRRLYVGNPLLAVEAGETYLYFTTSLWSVGMEGYSMLARARLVSPVEVDPDSIEPIPGTGEGLGWVGNPALAVSGLELFFDSSRPDGDWMDPEIFLSSRASPGAAWGLPVPISLIGNPALADDGVSAPVLLPDGRTLLYWDGSDRVARIAVRASLEPGDVSFLPEAGPAFTDAPATPGDESQLLGLTLSCDGSRVLYVRESWSPEGLHPTELRQVALLGLSPPSFGPPEPYDGIVVPLQAAGSPDDRIVSFVEAPDCSAVYFATSAGELFHRADRCGP